MVYTKTITEPSGGSIANPTQYKMPLTVGLIYQFDIYFPPGSAGLMRVAVKHGGYSLYPSEPGEWFFGDDRVITFPDRYYISADPAVLDIYAYNSDDTYDHEFQLRIGLVSDPMLIKSFLPAEATEDLEKAIRDIIETQDMTREAQRKRAIALAERLETENASTG